MARNELAIVARLAKVNRPFIKCYGKQGDHCQWIICCQGTISGKKTVLPEVLQNGKWTAQSSGQTWHPYIGSANALPDT